MEPYVSRSMEEILAEVRGLTQNGVKEIILACPGHHCLRQRSLWAAYVKGTVGITGKKKISCGSEFFIVIPARIDEALLRLIAQEEKKFVRISIFPCSIRKTVF